VQVHQSAYDTLQDQKNMHLAGQVQYNTQHVRANSQHVRENSQQLRDNKVILDELRFKTEKVDGVEKEDSLKLRMLEEEVGDLKKMISELKPQVEEMKTEINKFELMKGFDWAPSGDLDLMGQKFMHLKL
jgi:predicted RNase H-like nuclease (RuvC/YqgF family)